MNYNSELSDWISAEVRAEMARQEKTSSDLCAYLGVSHPSLRRRMKGRHPWSIEELEKVADYLGVSVLKFLPDEADLQREAVS